MKKFTARVVALIVIIAMLTVGVFAYQAYRHRLQADLARGTIEDQAPEIVLFVDGEAVADEGVHNYVDLRAGDVQVPLSDTSMAPNGGTYPDNAGWTDSWGKEALRLKSLEVKGKYGEVNDLYVQVYVDPVDGNGLSPELLEALRLGVSVGARSDGAVAYGHTDPTPYGFEFMDGYGQTPWVYLGNVNQKLSIVLDMAIWATAPADGTFNVRARFATLDEIPDGHVPAPSDPIVFP